MSINSEQVNFMSNRNVFGTALTFWLACSNVVFAQVDLPAVAATKTAINAYFQGCAAHLGRAADLKAFVREQGFEPAHPQLYAELLGSKTGDAWILPETWIGVAVTLQHDGMVCRVLLRQASEEQFRDLFSAIVERTARANVEVSKLVDDVTQREGQVVRTLAYRLSARPRQPGAADRMLSLTTNASPSARIAVTMTAAVIPPNGR